MDSRALVYVSVVVGDGAEPVETTCVLCGHALEGALVVAPGLDLCSACLEPRDAKRVRGDPEIPPVWFGLVLGGVFFGAILLPCAVTGAVASGLGADTLVAFRASGVAALVGVIVFTNFLDRLETVLKRGWKRDVARALGLAHLPDDRFSFAFLLRAPSVGVAWNVDDAGLLADTDDALVFLGRTGRVVVPLESIQGSMWIGGRGRRWIRLFLVDGSVLWVTIQEGASAWGGYKATLPLAERLWRRAGQPRTQLGRAAAILRVHAEALRGVTARNAPSKLEMLEVRTRDGAGPPDVGSRLGVAGCEILALALSSTLAQRGWVVSPERRGFLGGPILERGPDALDPKDLVARLARGELDMAGWCSLWGSSGIAEVDLSEGWWRPSDDGQPVTSRV